MDREQNERIINILKQLKYVRVGSYNKYKSLINNYWLVEIEKEQGFFYITITHTVLNKSFRIDDAQQFELKIESLPLMFEMNVFGKIL